MSLEESTEKEKTYICKYCGESFNELWQLGNHVKYECEAAREAKEKEKKAEKEVGEGPPGVLEGPEARQLVAQFGRDGLNQVKKERLKEVLELAPGVGKKVVPWILRKWDLNARLRDDPQEFYRVLHDECGLKPNIAFSIVRDVWTAEEEFADLLYQRGEQPIFFRSGYGYGQPMFWPGQPQQAFTPQTFRPPGMMYTREDIERLRSDWAKEERLRKLEEQIANLYKDLPKMIREAVPQPEGLQYEEVREPIDAEGNICHPDEAVSVRVRRIPITSRESVEVKELRGELKSLRETIQKRDIDQLRSEIREIKHRKPEESEEVKALRMQLNESRKAIEDLKGTIEAKDRQALADKLSSLENRLNTLATVGGEWKTDEMKVLASSIHELADIIKGRRPIDAAKEILAPPSVTFTRPPPEMADESTRGRVIEELSKHGLVTRIIERPAPHENYR